MEEELIKKIELQQLKIDATYESVEKLRKYFLWTLIMTVVTFVLPLIVAIIAIPFMVSTISSLYGGTM